MTTHKSEKIHNVVHDNDRKLNLHEIKAQTGAGSGYKIDEPTTNTQSVNDTYSNNSKNDKIHEAVSNTEGKVNLHTIKAQTGAGDGYVTQGNLSDDINTPKCDCDNVKSKSHKINAVFYANDRKLNLHEIKARTGAGSGHKH